MPRVRETHAQLASSMLSEAVMRIARPNNSFSTQAKRFEVAAKEVISEGLVVANGSAPVATEHTAPYFEASSSLFTLAGAAHLAASNSAHITEEGREEWSKAMDAFKFARGMRRVANPRRRDIYHGDLHKAEELIEALKERLRP